MNVSRRGYLSLGSSTTIGVLTGCVNAPVRPERIIVVGGGIAGLSAANRLQAEGLDVILLEARDRLGGRIWTQTQWGNASIDLGASWLHGTARNPVFDRARTLDIETTQTDYENMWIYGEDGARLGESAVDGLYRRFGRLMNGINRVRRTAATDRSLRSVIDSLLDSWSLSTLERRRLEFAITAEIEHEYAADTRDLSLFSYDFGNELLGSDELVLGGFDRLLADLADGIDVRHEHVVTEIAYRSRGVHSTTSQGAVNGDRAVITLPLGVLKSGQIQFVPELPQYKRRAIHALDMGVLNKVALRFPSAFWSEQPELLGRVAEPSDRWAEFLNLYHYTGEPVLVAFNAGRFARRTESWPDETIVAAVMNALQNIYGQSVPDPTDWIVTRWQSDQFARGAYASLPPGASKDDVIDLSLPVGDRLFFAGEATSTTNPGTVQGAYQSGLRVAREILSRTETNNQTET